MDGLQFGGGICGEQKTHKSIENRAEEWQNTNDQNGTIDIVRGTKKDEKIFKLIKFRTMTCEKDADGNLLPDEDRLTSYGQFLRSTSLDELPEIINILKGDMSLVGPRPLLVQYLPLYNQKQKRRHEVRPGLTGLAQISGRY